MTDKEKEAIAERQMELNPLVPPDKRGHPPEYRIDKNDDEDLKEQKRERKKKWLAAMRAEIIKSIEDNDKQRVFQNSSVIGSKGKIVFKKGVPVFLPDHHPLVPKLRDLSAGQPQKKRFDGHQVVVHEQFKMEKGDTTSAAAQQNKKP
jgi:hypothetical protein